MNIPDHTPTELIQANRLEAYLAGLERKQLVPTDVTAEDIALYRMARNFATQHVQPRILEIPKQRSWWRLGVLWLSPVPLLAAAAFIFMLYYRTPTVTNDPDLSTELAVIDQIDNDLLALQVELDDSLQEIDLLTSTDYIDQL